MNICETNKTAQAKLDAATAKYEQEKTAEFDKDFAIISQFDKYIEDVCYCLAGCAKPNAATEGMFPYVRGARISLNSVLDAISWAKAIDLGVTYEDNPYSNNYGKFSNDSFGLTHYSIRDTKAMHAWQKNVLIPKISDSLGRNYEKLYISSGFDGYYWLMPEDETVGECLKFDKAWDEWVYFFFPIFGQLLLCESLMNLVKAMFTKKWSRG